MPPKIYKIITAVLAGIFIFVFAAPFSTGSQAEERFPRLANYYLKWNLSESDLPELAKWDVLVLDMETQITSRPLLEKLRQLNPNITLLVYITSEEIRTDAATSGSILRRKLASQIANNWYVRRPSGEAVSFWPGTTLLNLADNSPLVNGNRFSSVLARFTASELLATGLWDGVFYDNAFDGITWFSGLDVDLDLDGVPDQNIDNHWRAGMKFLYNETRRLTNNRYLIVGNGGSKVYRDELNGMMLENFPNSGGWRGTMDIYKFFEDGAPTPQLMIINRNTLNSGRRDNYASMRFGLASALMGRGYYAFDYGDQDHGQTWWYDEYNVKLGDPAGPPKSQNARPLYQEDVWRRDFAHGVALVNATDKKQVVDLGGEYEKIIGTQDTRVNDGSITSQVTLGPYDGLIMFKTFKTLFNAWFANGSFARFYRQNGERARNGFFIFEDGQPGGANIYNVDLDANGDKEKIIATGAKLEIFNSSGERWFSDYPFGTNFKGTLNVAVGHLLGVRAAQLLVAPSLGNHLMLYDYHGAVLKNAVYPLGKKYQGGFTVAIAEAPGKEAVAVVGTGLGVRSEVIEYNPQLTKITKRWYPFGVIKTPVSVAAGDFNGDGVSEVAIVPMTSRAPVVKVFTLAGKLKNQFSLRGFFGTQTFKLGAVDVNFEGRDEIVVMSAN
ncbi:MAG: hypothetical protein EXS55_04215 [Candidatus Magasanikbacteria bacterium]|nr:hypothetical protein [Candidatus Magasanikbacteria bacterium]